MSGGDAAARVPGWYRDPRVEGAQRYWDGLQWTEFVRAEPAPTPPQESAAAEPPHPSPSPAVGAPPAQVQAVARAQRFALVVAIVYLVALALQFGTLMALRSGTDPGDLRPAAILGLAAGLVAVVMALVAVYRLVVSLDYSTGVLVLCLVLMFVGVLGLIGLLVLSSQATAFLRANGVAVGFLGARP